MRKRQKRTAAYAAAVLVSAALTAAFTCTSFAGSWEQENGKWWYDLGGGNRATGWQWIDTDGDGKISLGDNTVEDPGDRKVIGNSLPRYSYNFGGSLNWNGIDFSVLFQGIGKRDWYPTSVEGQSNAFWYNYCRPHNSWLTQQFIDQVWTEDNPDAYFPFPRGYEAYSGTAHHTLECPNDRYLQNIAYIRLKNLSLGYTLPIPQKHIQSIRIYFNGENLWYWSPMKKINKYIDPDSIYSTTSHFYGSAEAYYFSKVFTMGLNITF